MFFLYFSGPWQCYLLGSQWNSNETRGYYPKYLKLCSEDEQSFYSLERHGGKGLMTQFAFWGGLYLYDFYMQLQ